MNRFYAPKINFDGDILSLGSDETHHLRDVLRRRVGDDVHVFDGEGDEYLCRVESITKKDAKLAIVEKVSPTEPESPLDLVLAVAVLKGEKFDLVIQKAVELGVMSFVPVLTMRCDVKVRDDDKKRERWHKIAVEAARQCGRAKLMTMAVPTLYSRLVVQTESDPGTRILFSERGGGRFATINAGKKMTAFIGPEGGWDDLELDAAREHGITVVTLGGRILRAETAVISIAAILQHRFGDVN